MTDEVIDAEVTDMQIVRQSKPELMLTAAFDVATAQKRLVELQEFVKFYMKEGEDFGTIPGTPKPTLYKPGADKLCDIYGIADTYKVTNRTEDWDRNLFDYEIECTLLSKRSGTLVATGLGSCNSYEGRYRWRDKQRICPECKGEFIIKGKVEYGGGWLCYKKKGGCGAKFGDGDKAIEGQESGKVENEDIPTLKNTILKMAKKRAKVDAVLSATRSSGLFTQDVEDWAKVENHEEGSAQEAKLVADKKLREAAAGDESLTLTKEGDRLFIAAGKGLPIVRAAMSTQDMGRFQIELKGTKFYVPVANVHAFADFAVKQKVTVNWTDSEATQAPDNLTKQLQASINEVAQKKTVEAASGDPNITKCIEREGKKGPYVAIKWNGIDLNIFKKELFPILFRAAEDHTPVWFDTEPNGKYINFKRLVRLAGRDYSDPHNQTSPVEEEMFPDAD